MVCILTVCVTLKWNILSLMRSHMIAEKPFWKNETVRFIQFQENVHINFAVTKNEVII